MSKSRKLSILRNGQPLPPLTRLKRAVIAMPIEEAEQLYALSDSLSGSDWRAQVARTLGINLSSDSKVTNFRAWFKDWQDLQEFNDAMERDEAALAASGKTPEQVRELVIRNGLARAEARQDSKLAMSILDRDISLEVLKRKDREIALKQEALAQSERKVQMLEAKMRAASEALQQAANSGGLTPETLRKIEGELKLL